MASSLLEVAFWAGSKVSTLAKLALNPHLSTALSKFSAEVCLSLNSTSHFPVFMLTLQLLTPSALVKADCTVEAQQPASIPETLKTAFLLEILVLTPAA